MHIYMYMYLFLGSQIFGQANCSRETVKKNCETSDRSQKKTLKQHEQNLKAKIKSEVKIKLNQKKKHEM